MDLEEIRHTPWTCRWGRFRGKVVQPAAVELTWDCSHPELCPVRRNVLVDECEVCPYWEASIVPLCAAMGWRPR
jgi:hypothetical protein